MQFQPFPDKFWLFFPQHVRNRQQPKAHIAQRCNPPRIHQLLLAVKAVTCKVICFTRMQQPNLVIMPQHPDTDAGQLGKIPNLQHMFIPPNIYVVFLSSIPVYNLTLCEGQAPFQKNLNFGGAVPFGRSGVSPAAGVKILAGTQTVPRHPLVAFALFFPLCLAECKTAFFLRFPLRARLLAACFFPQPACQR